MLVDRDEASARETQELIVADGDRADLSRRGRTQRRRCRALAEHARELLGRIVLHNNVGIGAGDGRATEVGRDWDRIFDVNLKGTWRQYGT